MAPAALRAELPRPDRLLVVVAHPGDAERALGGTVALWVDAGTEARLLCATSGDARGDDPDADPIELAARGEREQREAAAIVGYRAVTFLHRPEGAVANDLALREELVRAIRAFRPGHVATGDPRVLLRRDGRVNDADHRAVGAAVIDALPVAAQAMAFPHLARAEGLAPWATPHLVLWGSERPTHKLDPGAALATREQALRAHPSRGPLVAPGTSEPFELIGLG